jgi:hypothetical protein
MNRIEVGDILILKKGHPCGTNRWEVIRTGADVKLKCTGCDRVVMLDRPTLNKRIKKVINLED